VLDVLKPGEILTGEIFVTYDVCTRKHTFFYSLFHNCSLHENFTVLVYSLKKIYYIFRFSHKA